MNVSMTSNLSIQGQQMNIGNANAPVRSQWGGGPRGTIINVLEHASVYDHTMNNATSDIGLKAPANRVNPDRKNETYVITSPKSSASSSPTIPRIPVQTDLIVEELNDTLTSHKK